MYPKIGIWTTSKQDTKFKTLVNQIIIKFDILSSTIKSEKWRVPYIQETRLWKAKILCLDHWLVLGKKESSLKLTFSWAFGSLWWTRLTACNPFIRFSVPPWTSTHPYFHYTSAKSLSVPLECEDNFNWPSAWPWCTAWEAHKCKHLGNILCTNWNIKWVCYQVKLRFRDQTYSIWSEYVISSGWFHCPNQCCFLSRLQFKLWLHV